MKPPQRLSPFAAASLLAFLAAAAIMVGLRLYVEVSGPPRPGDSRIAYKALAAAFMAVPVAVLVLTVSTWALCRHRVRLPLPEIRGGRGLAPVQGRWLTLLLLGLAVASTTWLLGIEPMTFLWVILMIPVTVVAALTNSGDV